MLPQYYALLGVNMQEDILTSKTLWNIVRNCRSNNADIQNIETLSFQWKEKYLDI